MESWRRGIRKAALSVFLLAAACHDPRMLHGVRAAASIDPAFLDFGEVPVGEWREARVHLRNVGYVSFRALGLESKLENDAFHSRLDPGSVLPGESLDALVRFHPLAEGPTGEEIQIRSDADFRPAEETVPLRGLGVPARTTLAPALLDFETLEVDDSRTLGLEVRNLSDLPLQLSVKGSGSAAFELTSGEVPPLSTEQIGVRFQPRSVGRHLATVEALACPSCTPVSAALVGRAVVCALEFDPSPIPFLGTPVHERTSSRTVATNVVWRPVTALSVTTSDPSFEVLSFPAGATLAPGEAAELGLGFWARYAGPNQGTLKLDYQSDRPRHVTVGLDAQGGGPRLAVTPASVDFGELPAGGKAEATLRLTNAGTNGDLLFRGLVADADYSHFLVSAPTAGTTPFRWSVSAWPTLVAPNLVLSPGSEGLEIRAYFQPLAPGSFTTTLWLQSDDPFGPERPVSLFGRARAAGPCVYRLKPEPRLEFGNVPPGTGAVLGFYFENIGTQECAVKDIALLDDAQGTFFMPGGPLTGGVLFPTDAFSAQVAFKSHQPGHFQGSLELTVNNPAKPHAILPLDADAIPSCLVAAPNFLDFGPVRYDCAPTPLRTQLSNQCSSPVLVRQLLIGPGTSDQFTIEDAPPLPMTLGPGEGFEVEVAYQRKLLGQHFSPLWAWADGEPRPFLVPLLAETNHEGLQIERFVQGTADLLDVLFVVSNTTTMGPYHARLQAAVPAWLAQAQAQHLDLHVGTTTSGLVPQSAQCPGGANGGEAGRLFPADRSRDRVASSTDPGAAFLVRSNLAVGNCHHLAQGLETMRQALTAPLSVSADDPRTPLSGDGNLGFLREAARLAIVFLADEDDHSGFGASSYAQLVRSLKGSGMAHRANVFAVLPQGGPCLTAGPDAPRLAEVVRLTQGSTLSICESSYEPLLKAVSSRAFGPERRFPLSQVPADPTSIAVSVGGASAPASRWAYDPAANAIEFALGNVPLPGETIEVRYRATCAP